MKNFFKTKKGVKTSIGIVAALVGLVRNTRTVVANSP